MSKDASVFECMSDRQILAKMVSVVLREDLEVPAGASITKEVYIDLIASLIAVMGLNSKGLPSPEQLRSSLPFPEEPLSES